MKRLIFTVLALFLMVHPVLTGAEEPAVLGLSLNEALDRALKSNFDIRSSEEKLRELEAMIGEARSGALPQLAGTAGYDRYFKKPQIFLQEQRFVLGFNNNYSAGVTLTQPIYAAGKVLKALRAAQNETASGKASLADLKEEIRLQVKKVYYQILLTNRAIVITEKTLKELNDQLTAIKARFEKGLESDYTLMRQEVQVSNVAPELSAYEQQKIVLENTLKVLMGMHAMSAIKLTDDFTFSSKDVPAVDALVSRSIKERQDLIASGAHLEALNQIVGVQRGGYLPTINLVGNLDWVGQSDKLKILTSRDQYTAIDAGLTLSWQLFDGLKTHYKIQEAKSQFKIAQNDHSKLKENVVSDVLNSHAKFLESVKREVSQKKSLDLAQKAVNIASLRFSEGLTSQLELNDTILQRDQAEKLYAQAVYDCLDSEATLQRTVGGNLWEEQK